MRTIDRLRKITRSWRFDPLVPITRIYRLLRTPIRLALNVVYFIPAAVLSLLNVRFPLFFVYRIGHLLLEPDCYIKEIDLGILPQYRSVFLATKPTVANLVVLEYWRRFFIVITTPAAVALLRPLTWHPLTRVDIEKYAVSLHQTADFPTIQTLWADRPPLLAVSENHKIDGAKFLEKMGIRSGAWFVCVHSREGGYSPDDEHIHSHRNSPFEDYLEAVDYVISQGGFCIRMGDPTMAPISEKYGLIDYAHHPSRADWLDLYLSANCRLFLGNTSGAFFMATIFGVPVACANMTPLGSVFPFGAKDIGIPKLYRDSSSRRLLTFKEIMESSMSKFRTNVEFEDFSIELLNNSPTDIKDLLIEQLQKATDPNFAYTEEDDELQNRFRILFKPGHYSFGSASRIGSAFLRKYQDLLQ